MLMRISKEQKARQKDLAKTKTSDGLHLVYYCHGCGKIVTKIDILEAWARKSLPLCSCGSKTIRPGNVTAWQEFTVPKLWKLIFYFYTKRLSPPPLPPTPQENAERERIARAALRSYGDSSRLA